MSNEKVVSALQTWNEDLGRQWRAGTFRRRDFEMNALSLLVHRHRLLYPESDPNMENLFEGILIRMAEDKEPTEFEWESIQRMYFLHFGFIMLEDIKEGFEFDK